MDLSLRSRFQKEAPLFAARDPYRLSDVERKPPSAAALHVFDLFRQSIQCIVDTEIDRPTML